MEQKENTTGFSQSRTDGDRKLLILDIDGTLANSEKKITPATKNAVTEIMRCGHKVMLASGRPLQGMEWAAHQLEFDRYGGYLLSFNGAKIVRFDTMETVYERKVPKKYLPFVHRYALEHRCGIISYDGDNIISGNGINEYIELEARINHLMIKEVDDFASYFQGDVIKCLFCAPPEQTEGMEAELKQLIGNEVNIYRSEPFYVEVMPSGVDKASSIAHMLPKLGISRENCIACGDGYNDITMIRYAGTGIAMGNAQQAVKDAADWITDTNDEDGVVKVIQKFFPE